MRSDPVCGMTVDEKRSRITSVYEGTTYHFCSTQCKEDFEADPRIFIGG